LGISSNKAALESQIRDIVAKQGASVSARLRVQLPQGSPNSNCGFCPRVQTEMNPVRLGERFFVTEPSCSSSGDGLTFSRDSVHVPNDIVSGSSVTAEATVSIDFASGLVTAPTQERNVTTSFFMNSHSAPLPSRLTINPWDSSSLIMHKYGPALVESSCPVIRRIIPQRYISGELVPVVTQELPSSFREPSCQSVRGIIPQRYISGELVSAVEQEICPSIPESPVINQELPPSLRELPLFPGYVRKDPCFARPQFIQGFVHVGPRMRGPGIPDSHTGPTTQRGPCIRGSQWDPGFVHVGPRMCGPGIPDSDCGPAQ